jgi:hypothetical protein
MGMWGLVGSLSFVILIVHYISDTWSRPAWRGLSKPVPLIQVLGEWVVFMLLFSGLTVLLEKTLDSACWTLKVIESVRKP